jgi:hypothetical protein
LPGPAAWRKPPGRHRTTSADRQIEALDSAIEDLDPDARPKGRKFSHVPTTEHEAGEDVGRRRALNAERNLAPHRGRSGQLLVTASELSEYVFDMLIELIKRLASGSSLPSHEP